MSNKEDILSAIEKNLENVLKPVSPSSNFVHATRKKFNFASPVVVAQRVTDKQYILMGLASIISITLLIITAVRVIFYLIGKSK